VIGAHGIGGAVVVRVAVVDSVLEKARIVFVAGRGVGVVAARAAGRGRVVLRLAGIEDRDAALALRGAEVEVEREALPALAAGEYYRCDIVGLGVWFDDGREIGVVTDVIETGANDVFVVRGADGREVLVPVIADVVVAIDLGAGRVTIRTVPGLFDE
jgi:16S rRNA processing protein RimM